jgi:hypothetical protein
VLEILEVPRFQNQRLARGHERGDGLIGYRTFENYMNTVWAAQAAMPYRLSTGL